MQILQCLVFCLTFSLLAEVSAGNNEKKSGHINAHEKTDKKHTHKEDLDKGQETLNKGEFKKSSYYYQRILASDPENTKARIGLSMSLYKQGLYDRALHELNSVIEKVPVHEDALTLRSQVYIAQQNWPDVIADAERLISINSQNKHAYMCLDSAYSTMGDLKAAEAAKQRFEQLQAAEKNTLENL